MNNFDPFDYLPSGTSNKIEQKWYPWSSWPMGFSQMKHFIKLEKKKKHLQSRWLTGF
jgi:hypothetical protein